MKKNQWMCAAGVALLVVVAAEVRAAPSCTFVSHALSFPNYDTFSSSPTDAVGSVVVSCTDTVAHAGVTAQLSIGTSAHGSDTDRKMSSSGTLLSYGIYSDSTRATNWGGTNKPSQTTGAFAANASAQATFTLYGRIAAQQNVRAGSYSDSVPITVSP